MTEESDRDLVERAETALSGMALREPDWDGLVSRIEGAVGAAPAEDAALFEAPFPAGEEDGTEAPVTKAADDSVPAPTAELVAAPVTSASVDPGPTLSVAPVSDELDEGWSDAPEADATATAVAAEEPEEIEAASEPAAADEAPKSPREGVSLADLARASVARRGSEATDIAKQSLAVASQSRAEGVERAQRLQAVSAVAPTSVAPPPAQRGGETLRGPWIGVAIAGVGLAAAFGLVLSRPDSSPAPVTIIQQAPPPATPRVEAPQAPVAKAETLPALEPTPAREATLDPSSLPTLPREPSPHGETKPGGAAAKAPAPTPAPAPGAGKVAAEKIVLEEDHKAAPKTPSSGAPKPGDAKLRPAELSSGTMTDRPSAGAAQAAVGAVLGNARACVAGHPQPSSAQLVFNSDGQVQSVTVGGPAAGTPAAGCIETALKKARVQPFAASSFSLGVTVRPP